MSELKEARVPDIGGHSDVPVIELLVQPGDTVAKDQGLSMLYVSREADFGPMPGSFENSSISRWTALGVARVAN